MKKILSILLVLACLLGLVDCDPGSNCLDADALLKNTVKIELVQYENDNPKLSRITKRKKPSFDFGKVTLIATLDKSKTEEVVTDIAGREYLVFGNALNEPIGKTLILYQRDGSMVVLFGCVYENEKGGKRYYGDCNIFDEDGTFIEHIGDVSSNYIDELESKYFLSNP